MKVLIDTNIMLDGILEREPFVSDALALETRFFLLPQKPKNPTPLPHNSHKYVGTTPYTLT